MENSWTDDLKTNAIFRLDENVRMVSIALSKIGEDDIWTKQNRVLNTIGNQLLHICGNMTQYIVSGLGGEKDTRNRNLEFTTEGGHSNDELLKKLLFTTQKATEIINEATEDQLTKMHKVQGFNLSGIGLILHAVEHFSYHTGQIASQVKLIIDEPLGFYAGLDLDTLNEPDDAQTIEGHEDDIK